MRPELTICRDAPDKGGVHDGGCEKEVLCQVSPICGRKKDPKTYYLGDRLHFTVEVILIGFASDLLAAIAKQIEEFEQSDEDARKKGNIIE